MNDKKSSKLRGKKAKVLRDDANPSRILRNLGDNEVFYFYYSIGKPAGESARSLADFADKTKIVKLDTLVFHKHRNDFKNWIFHTIGDKKLAATIGKIRFNDERLRAAIVGAIENRMQELKQSTLIFQVQDGIVITN